MFLGQEHGNDGVDAAEANQSVIHQIGAIGRSEEDDFAAVGGVAQKLEDLAKQVLGDGVAAVVAAGADVRLVEFVDKDEHGRQALSHG